MEKVNISPDAQSFLARKSEFYGTRQRLPRIILTEMSCGGAKFAVHHDYAREGDLRMRSGDLEILADAEMVEIFGGFDLELERFFFASRIRVKPRRESFQCGCKTKCKIKTEET